MEYMKTEIVNGYYIPYNTDNTILFKESVLKGYLNILDGKGIGIRNNVFSLFTHYMYSVSSDNTYTPMLSYASPYYLTLSGPNTYKSLNVGFYLAVPIEDLFNIVEFFRKEQVQRDCFWKVLR